jgi:hypothetical protein
MAVPGVATVFAFRQDVESRGRNSEKRYGLARSRANSRESPAQVTLTE